MSTIYHCIRRDVRYMPPIETVAHEADTSRAAVEWLEQNGGGWYRNILHGVCFEVKAIQLKEGGTQ